VAVETLHLVFGLTAGTVEPPKHVELCIVIDHKHIHNFCVTNILFTCQQLTNWQRCETFRLCLTN
jgi:hypothetical protein